MTRDENLTTEPTKVYTLSEALEYEKIRNSSATTRPPVNWVSVKTGKKVSIGSCRKET
jgi:hypothetical protein